MSKPKEKVKKIAQPANGEAVSLLKTKHVAALVGITTRELRKWLRTDDGGFPDHIYTRYGFPADSPVIAAAQAHFAAPAAS
jgi:carbamoylphosphate synthase small subunit